MYICSSRTRMPSSPADTLPWLPVGAAPRLTAARLGRGDRGGSAARNAAVLGSVAAAARGRRERASRREECESSSPTDERDGGSGLGGRARRLVPGRISRADRDARLYPDGLEAPAHGPRAWLVAWAHKPGAARTRARDRRWGGREHGSAGHARPSSPADRPRRAETARPELAHSLDRPRLAGREDARFVGPRRGLTSQGLPCATFRTRRAQLLAGAWRERPAESRARLRCTHATHAHSAPPGRPLHAA